MSAVSMPTPITRASSRTIACGRSVGCLAQSFEARLLDLGDLAGHEAQPRHVAPQLGERVRVVRYRVRPPRRRFRADAAVAAQEVYEFLEAEGFLYAIRLPNNPVLQSRISHLLRRPVGRPPHRVRRYYASFSYQAGSWSTKRRVVAKVEWHPGELCPRIGYIVTNMARAVERVVAFYNQRGTAEQHIKEGKNAIKWTRLSCWTFRNNAVRLQLHALAYSLANFMRKLALPEEVEHWSLTTLREKLVKIGARIVRHGRYVVFQLAEIADAAGAVRRHPRRIDGLRLRSPPVSRHERGLQRAQQSHRRSAPAIPQTRHETSAGWVRQAEGARRRPIRGLRGPFARCLVLPTGTSLPWNRRYLGNVG